MNAKSCLLILNRQLIFFQTYVEVYYELNSSCHGDWYRAYLSSTVTP